MRLLVVSFLVALSICLSIAARPTRLYQCITSSQGLPTCRLSSNLTIAGGGVAQGPCQLTCEQGNIWPKPSGALRVSKSIVQVDIDRVVCKHSAAAEVSPSLMQLEKAACEQFRSSIRALAPRRSSSSSSSSSSTTGRSIIVAFDISNGEVTSASIDNDESYSLSMASDDAALVVKLSASTYFGARHGLETASQLLRYDESTSTMIAASWADIEDKPAFKYRGVMIDTSRNYISVNKLKENIRAMGYNKMNVLHWHLTDTASFPIDLPSHPELAQGGAYSEEQIYTAEIVNDIITYANTYGVMVMPEIDAPAHMAEGWSNIDPSLGPMVLCTDNDGIGGSQWVTDALEPPSGQFNIVNENAYSVLNDVYRDTITMFKKEMGHFHIGGDEVIIGSDSGRGCYNNSKLAAPVIDYLSANNLDRNSQDTFYGLWENFTIRATEMVKEAFGDRLRKLHVWGGGGTDSSGVSYNMLARPEVESVLPPSIYRIQVWDESQSSITPSLLRKGYEVVLSNSDYVYLDCGSEGFTNPGGYWCDPLHEWYHIYQYMSDVTTLWKLKKEERSRIVGSETLIWTEMADDTIISQKIWPRSAALAESLWSDPQDGWFAADPRMLQWRATMVRRGIDADGFRPQWCLQREAYACALPGGEPQ